ncbi:MAG: hypothetical protein KC418_07980 [Anaerolineales bacterium]|nr:hypothetical protein [Anaerolineales bacterium]MCB8954136.1 hypothetical protein [Ardenticatenales bacterium]
MNPLYIGGKRVKLQATDLIQAGGEGMVFRWQGQAVKVYHQPQPGHGQKLAYWRQNDLARQVPDVLLGPTDLVTDKQGMVQGFVMPALPATTHPMKQLANPNFTARHQFDPRHVILWLQHAHNTLTRLHRLGIVVGDLNDHNLFFARPTPGGHAITYWIDVDSYQFGGFPCPVAMEAFLDPHLAGVGDLSRQPVFAPDTDWYAFFVLLVKSLLQVHPFGGVHPQHKTLPARIGAGVTILSPDVTYPRRARPVETLSDDLLHHLDAVFARGRRSPFPASLLADYANSLMTCAHCGQVYPRERAHCPGCRQQHTPPAPAIQRGRLHFRLLLHADGLITQVAVMPSGRIQAIVRAGREYRLVRAGVGGVLEDVPLFTGEADYHFAFWGQNLVVNQTGTDQLLLLEATAAGFRPATRLQTAMFRQEAVFAATDHHLFRLANGYLMRGAWQQGHFVESIAADARRDQTQFWAAPDSPLALGFYRLFADHHFFMMTEKGEMLPLSPMLPTAAGIIRDTAALFNANHAALLLQTSHKGQETTHTRLYDRRGGLRHEWRSDTDTAPLTGRALLGETVLWATDAGIHKQNATGQTLLSDSAGHVAAGDLLHAHPQGLLIQQASRLWLATGK